MCQLFNLAAKDNLMSKNKISIFNIDLNINKLKIKSAITLFFIKQLMPAVQGTFILAKFLANNANDSITDVYKLCMS